MSEHLPSLKEIKVLVAELDEPVSLDYRSTMALAATYLRSLSKVLGRLEAAHNPRNPTYRHIHYMLTGETTPFREGRP